MKPKCPIKRIFCTQVDCKKYDCGSWFCVGTKERKSPGGVKMDVIRMCWNDHFHKKSKVIECTPDEAAMFAGLLARATAEWLDEWDGYQGFIAENDK